MKAYYLLLPALVIFFSCTKDDVPDEDCLPPATSSLSFSYSGEFTGSYSMMGEVPSSSSAIIYDYNWAMGGTFEEWGKKWIMIHSHHSGLSIQIHVPDKGVGKFSLPSDRNMDSAVLAYAPAWEGKIVMTFFTGEVNVTYNSCNRIMGTFSGQLSGVHDGNNPVITINNGIFDVKLKPI
jgi:hypothetical protein